MADNVHTWNQNDIEQHLKSAVSQMTPDIWNRLDLSVPQEKECGDIHTVGREKKKIFRLRSRVQGLAAAACLCAVLGGGLYYREFRQIVSVVSLDVNPSLELYLNRRDTVIKTVSKNDDGQTVADQTDVTGQHLSEAVATLVTTMTQDGYLEQAQDRQSAVLVTVSSKQNEKKTEELKQNVTANVEYSLAVNEVPAVVYGQSEANGEVRQEVQQLADEYQISQGKAAFIQSLASENENLEKEEVSRLAQMNMSEISNQIEENSYRLGNQVQVTSVTEETITKVRVVRSASGSEERGNGIPRSVEPESQQTEAIETEPEETSMDLASLTESESVPLESQGEPELEMSREGETDGTATDIQEGSETLDAAETAEMADVIGTVTTLPYSTESCQKPATVEKPEETEGNTETLEETESEENKETLEEIETEESTAILEEIKESTEASEETETEESTEASKETETEESTEVSKETETEESTEASKETETEESTETSKEAETEESTEVSEETEESTGVSEETEESTAADEENESEDWESISSTEETTAESTEESETESETECTKEGCETEASETETERTEEIGSINKSSLLPAEEQYGPGMEEAIWESEWLDKENQAGQWLYGPGVPLNGDPLRVDTIYNSSNVQLQFGSQRQWIGSISEKARSRWYFQITEALQEKRN